MDIFLLGQLFHSHFAFHRSESDPSSPLQSIPPGSDIPLLASDERFNELLTLDLLPTDQGQEPAVAAPDIDPVITEAIEVVPLVEGNIPPEYQEQREYSTTASLALGLDNQEEYTRLSRYLHERGQLDAVPVGMDGACMFASFRRVINAPMEYTSAHLRHQLIITICNHKEFFYPLLMESIKGTHGFPRMDPDEYQRLYDEGALTDAQVDDHNTPGPFSFLGYLRAVQEPEFWGDELCLCLLSVCFQVGITVINAEGFTRVRFRHRKDIKDSNIMLCHCKGHHYVPACKYKFYCIQMGHPALRWKCVHLNG